MNKQQQIEDLLNKIQHGFYGQDTEILNVLPFPKALKISLAKLHTIRERKRVILRTTRFSLLIKILYFIISFFVIEIILNFFSTTGFVSITVTIIRLISLCICIIWLYKTISSFIFSLKIINAVKKIDEMRDSQLISAQMKQIEEVQNYNYQHSKRNRQFLKERFSKQRRRVQYIGIGICLITAPILMYCFQLPPESLTQRSIILPFFMMLGIGLILSPGLHRDELKFLYGTESVPYKLYPKPIKVCLVLSLILCFIMELWRNGIFS